MMKARIAPHGNEDLERYSLKTDSESCSPLGIRILLSAVVVKKWHLTKIHITRAFLQTGSAQRDVYVIPPRECSNREFYWLLLAASYGLLNTNAKWQKHSDATFEKLGLLNVAYVPQLFCRKVDGELRLIVLKVVDDILIGGLTDDRKAFVQKLKEHYVIGTIVHTPSFMKFLLD